MYSVIKEEDNDSTFNERIRSQVDNILNEDIYSHLGDKSVLNLLHLKTYTIDSKDPLEIDDAISIELIGSVTRVWVHIASPAFYLNFGSPLDIYARRKASSIYLCNKSITMFPMELVNKFSLIKNKERLTISISADIDKEGKMSNSNLCLALVSNKLQLSYEDADEILDIAPKEEKELLNLHEILFVHRNKRIANSPIFIDEEKGVVKLKNNKYILTLVSKTSSRLLVEEAMILAGSIVSKFAIKNNIFLPFRVQESSKVPFIDHLSNQAIKNYIMKRSLNRSYISTKASPHYTLGLDSYVQFTSPVRRYIDLLSHYQLTNYLRRNKLLSQETISNIITEFNLKYFQNIQYSRADEYQNKLKFINSEDMPIINALFLDWIRPENCFALVYMLNFSFEFSLNLRTTKILKTGQEIQLIKSDQHNPENQVLEMLVK